jgi:hypothetical protein
VAASLTAIRAGLAANLSGIAGVENVSPYVLSNPTPPVIWVRPAPDELITYHGAMRNGLELWHLVVEAYVGVGSDVGAQMLLDTLVESTGASSVKAALEADKTLGGAAADLKVDDAHGYAEYARPDGPSLLGCRWNVLVHMNGG